MKLFILNQKTLLLIMRVTVIPILLLSFFATLGFADTHGQEVLQKKISVFVTDGPIENVLRLIEEQASVNFTYNSSLVKNKRVTLQVENESVGQVLQMIFKEGVSIRVVDSEIILKSLQKENVDNEQASYSAVLTISGTVTDETGAIMAGVNVVEKGTTNGTSTDSNGKYVIDVTNESAVLSFSFVGFTTEEEAVGTRTEINVQLIPDIKTLSDIVVIAYGTEKKEKVTGSQISVKAAELTTSPLQSADQLLQGKVAGVLSLGGSGQPGSEQQIRIRGIGSITASSNPLFVIDGIPVNNGDFSQAMNGENARVNATNVLAGLNPNDIEDITVLKDAASSSIYGSRAANGVVLITTKKGKKGKTNVTFSSEYGVNDILLPSKGKPLNRAQINELYTEGIRNAGYPDAFAPLILSSIGLDPANTDDINWLNLVTRQGQTQQYNLSLNGGNEKTTFYLSGGYYAQKASTISSDFNRASANMGVQHQVNEKVKIGINLNLSGTSQNGVFAGGSLGNPVFSASSLFPSQNPYNKDGTLNTSNFGVLYNPLYLAEHDKRKYFNLKGIGSTFVEYKIVPSLMFTSKFGVDYNGIEENVYQNPVHGDGSFNGGTSSAYYTRLFNWNWINQLDYTKTFSNDISVSVKVGYEAQKNRRYQITAVGNNVPNNSDLYLPVVASTPRLSSGTGSDYSFGAWFTSATASYQGKYVLTASFRNDKSSRFGPDNRSANFYSIGGAWNVNNESFFSGLEKVVSSLKFRASYGINGNAGIGDYLWRNIYRYSSTNAYNGNLGSVPATPGNALLGWEQNKVFDIGLDAGFFDNRLSLVVDYYNRNTEDLLLEVPLSYSTGFGSQPQNVGSMRNRGIEVTLHATPIDRKVKWDVYVNYSRNVNRVTALDERSEIIEAPFIRKVDRDIQTFFLPEYAGVDTQTGEATWYVNTLKSDGTLDKTITKDYNAAQRIEAGSANPRFFGGFGTSLSWNRFKLGADFVYSVGGKIYDSFGAVGTHDGSIPIFNTNELSLERWQKPGDVTQVPQFVFNNQSNSTGTSTRFLYDGDYMRLRNLTLSYEVPPGFLKSTFISNLSLYIRGTNLLTFTKDKRMPFDPEVGIQGLTDNNLYQNRIVSMGVNIGF